MFKTQELYAVYSRNVPLWYDHGHNLGHKTVPLSAGSSVSSDIDVTATSYVAFDERLNNDEEVNYPFVV